MLLETVFRGLVFKYETAGSIKSTTIYFDASGRNAAAHLPCGRCMWLQVVITSGVHVHTQNAFAAWSAESAPLVPSGMTRSWETAATRARWAALGRAVGWVVDLETPQMFHLHTCRLFTNVPPHVSNVCLRLITRHSFHGEHNIKIKRDKKKHVRAIPCCHAHASHFVWRLQQMSSN